MTCIFYQGTVLVSFLKIIFFPTLLDWSHFNMGPFNERLLFGMHSDPLVGALSLTPDDVTLTDIYELSFLAVSPWGK